LRQPSFNKALITDFSTCESVGFEGFFAMPRD